MAVKGTYFSQNYSLNLWHQIHYTVWHSKTSWFQSVSKSCKCKKISWMVIHVHWS